MRKDTEFDFRIDTEMLELLKIEAEKIDASTAFVVRMLLREGLTARGHYATTETQRANVRAASAERARKPGKPPGKSVG
jgi:hypothetical protein